MCAGILGKVVNGSFCKEENLTGDLYLSVFEETVRPSITAELKDKLI